MRQKDMNQKTMIAFGDSLAFGWGVDRSARFTTLLDGHGGYHVLNRGKAGERTDEIHARFRLQVLDQEPDVLFLIGGSNNIFQGRDIEAAFRDLGAMTEDALRAGISVLLATTPPYCIPFDPPYWSKIVDLDAAVSGITALNGRIRGYASSLQGTSAAGSGTSSLLLCDLAADFLSLPEAEYRSLFLDEIHPNKKGHARYAACIRACLDLL